jgi:hypothetical protein
MSTRRLRKGLLRNQRTSELPPSVRRSGVHRKGQELPALRSEAPTLPPKPPISVTQVKLGAPVDELLYRFAVGDYKGALAVAEVLLDDECIPIVIVPPEVLLSLPLDHREAFLMSFVDGKSSLEAIVEASGIPLLDALRLLCQLIELKVVVIR